MENAAAEGFLSYGTEVSYDMVNKDAHAQQ